MQPNPKNLILNLLLAADGPLTASDAVSSCALFGIRENNARVALVRLASAGMVESAGRGTYRLGPQATGLADELSSWRTHENSICPWTGGWLMVSTGALSRSDRTALRARERALALLGFKALDSTLYVRPDNLVGHTAGTRERLYKLGMDAQAPVFSATELDAELDHRARQLWNGAALNKGYAQTRQKLQEWQARSEELDLETAARECYLLGNDAIRQLIFDPLLPEPLVDAAERRAFIDTVIVFDEAGQLIWRQLLPGLRGEKSATRAAATPPSSIGNKTLTH